MASLTVEPRQGIRLSLSNCSKIRSYQGGGEFWELQNQQVIRQTLGDFLPRAEESDSGVLFQHFVGGREVCSESIGTGTGGVAAVPQAELARLQNAVQVLKEKENDPLTDSNAKKLIAAFKLPDPAKDPEFYRLYGPKWNRKLLVLWGVEKEAGSALIPATALSRIRPQSSAAGWLNLWPWLLGLAALLIIAWMAWDWASQSSRDKSYAERNGSAENSATPPAGTPGDRSSPGRDLVLVLPDGRRGTSSASDALRASEPQRESSPDSARPSLPDPALSGLIPSSKAVPTASESRQSFPLKDSPPDVAPINSSSSPASSAPPQFSESPTRPAPTASKPSSSSAGSNPGTSPLTDKRADSPPDSRPLGPKSQAVSPSSAPENLSNTPADSPRPSSSPSADEASGTPSTLQMPTKTDENTPSLTDATSAGSGAPGAGENPSSASDPAALEITNTRTAGTLRNGKIEVLLNAIARDAGGNLVPLTEVSGWQIDGKPQLLNGKPLTTTSLPLQLNKGAHRVAVSGKGANDQPLRAEADVNVSIQVQESGNVQVKPRRTSAPER